MRQVRETGVQVELESTRCSRPEKIEKHGQSVTPPIFACFAS